MNRLLLPAELAADYVADLRLPALRQFQDTDTINIKGAFAEESATPDGAPLKRQRRRPRRAAPPFPSHAAPPQGRAGPGRAPPGGGRERGAGRAAEALAELGV